MSAFAERLRAASRDVAMATISDPKATPGEIQDAKQYLVTSGARPDYSRSRLPDAELELMRWIGLLWRRLVARTTSPPGAPLEPLPPAPPLLERLRCRRCREFSDEHVAELRDAVRALAAQASGGQSVGSGAISDGDRGST